ncbi:barstar family protein [Herbidospora daliensis]|uniref:barstar family protein n=1 Tax=Herbidospora daliensis TaxID=295585 RepID=UPI0012FBF834|nr:barstar family protein [Herbidospora daliensis]
MAPFDRDALISHSLDYELAKNRVTLFHRHTALEEAIDWLRAHGYEIVRMDASTWTTAADLHRDFARGFDFPDYYGANMAALNDCLSDVAAGAYGSSPDATGLALVLTGYDDFAKRHHEVAQATLDVVAENALSAMRFGHRLFCLVQSDDPKPVDASWNSLDRDDVLVRTLAELVMDMAWFFESCDDSVVDPDDAVKQMEWISHKLGTLPTEARTRLIALIDERAESEPELREFLQSLAENSGL